MTSIKKKIEYLEDCILDLRAEIQELRGKCPHTWTVTHRYNDGDGYCQSQQQVNYYQLQKCSECGLTRDIKVN